MDKGLLKDAITLLKSVGLKSKAIEVFESKLPQAVWMAFPSWVPHDKRSSVGDLDFVFDHLYYVSQSGEGPWAIYKSPKKALLGSLQIMNWGFKLRGRDKKNAMFMVKVDPTGLIWEGWDSHWAVPKQLQRSHVLAAKYVPITKSEYDMYYVDNDDE